VLSNSTIDAFCPQQVERTKTRPIASGEVSNFQALSYFTLNGSAALILLSQLNMYRCGCVCVCMCVCVFACNVSKLPSLLQSVFHWCFSSAVLAVSSVSLIVTYPLFKRITHWPQVVLGICYKTVLLFVTIFVENMSVPMPELKSNRILMPYVLIVGGTCLV